MSPVFFSTLPDGRVVEGLEWVPVPEQTGGPVLFVGNHQVGNGEGMIDSPD
jgi:hypothetical protein